MSESSETTDATVEASCFDTSSLIVPDRFKVWQDSISVLFDVSLAQESDAARFNARVESVLLDGIMLSRSVAGAQRYERGVDRIIADGIDHYMFQTFDKGHVDMVLGNEIVRGKPGTMIAGDMAETLDSVNSDYALISAFIPRRRLDPHLNQVGTVHGALIDTTSGSGRLLADYMHALMRSAHDMSGAAAVAATDALVLLAAAACNQVRVDLKDPPRWADHALLLRARSEISEHLSDSDLDADELAKVLGLSRSRLYRLFEPYGGIMHIVREQRLRRALNDLVSAKGQAFQVGEIAYRWGFSSPAQFSRAFRNRYGCSPREARNQGRLMRQKPDWDADLPVGDRKFETWIETLA